MDCPVQIRLMRKIPLLFLLLSGTLLFSSVLKAEAKFSAIDSPPVDALQAPSILLNGKPAEVTVQDLSGFGTRPLRLLVHRNNKERGEGFLRVYAVGVHDGDELKVTLAARAPGVRSTVYKIFREKSEGPRYLSMPASTYFDVPSIEEYRESITSYGEEFLVFVSEKTEAANEKNIQVRYFEERVRKLVIASFKTNMTFSSLKLRMKDFGGDETEKFFERDAQFLIDRMTRPQEIVLLRLWKIKNG